MIYKSRTKDKFIIYKCKNILKKTKDKNTIKHGQLVYLPTVCAIKMIYHGVRKFGI